jgi:hypothetical protein
MRHTMQPVQRFRSSMITALVAALCSGAVHAAAPQVLSLTVGEDYTYDSNVFRVHDDTLPAGFSHRSDSIWTSRATAALDKEFGRQHLTASLGASHVSYGSFSQLNHDTNNVQAGWRAGFGAGSEAGLSYNHSQTMSNLEDLTGSSYRNMVTSDSLVADVALRVAGDWLGVGSVSRGGVDNSRSELKSGEYYVSAYDAGVRYSPRNGNFVDFRVRKSEFQYNRVDPSKADNSYEQNELRLSGKWVPNGTSSVESGVALIQSSHDQASQQDLDYTGLTGYVNYTWKPTAGFSSSLKLARDVGAVGDVWGSYAKTDSLTSFSRWQSTSKLGFFVDASWRKQAFEGTQSLTVAGDRRDRLWSLGVGSDYLLTDKLLIALSVREQRRLSNVTTYSFTDKLVMLTGQYSF